MSAVGAHNTNANPNNINFTMKDTKLYVPVVNLSARDNLKKSNLLSKGFEILIYWNEYKTKSEAKNTTNEYRYFLKSTFAGVNRLFSLICFNKNAKTIQRSKSLFTKSYYQKLSSMEKTFI